MRILASVTYHEKSEVFVLVPRYCYYSWKQYDISTLYLNFNITTFAELRQMSKVYSSMTYKIEQVNAVF